MPADGARRGRVRAGEPRGRPAPSAGRAPHARRPSARAPGGTPHRGAVRRRGAAHRLAPAVADPRVLLLDEPTACSTRRPRGRVAACGARAPPATVGRPSWSSTASTSSGAARRACSSSVRRPGARRRPTDQVLHDDAARSPAWARGCAVRRAGGGGRRVARSAHGRACPRSRLAGARVLSARGLRVRRGQRTVLDGVDLDVHAGRVTAVVGLNGSGKSSLLLALAGCCRRGDGDGRLGGAGVPAPRSTSSSPQRARRARVGSAPRRLPDVDERVSAPGATASRGWRTATLRLSGGQQRRLSLGAMAVCGHDVLLADEPTFGQDRRTSAACADALRRLADEGRGVVLVTHDLRLVGEVADDVLRPARRARPGARPRRRRLADDACSPAPGCRCPRCCAGGPPATPCAACAPACASRSTRGARMSGLGRALPHDSVLHRRNPTVKLAVFLVVSVVVLVPVDPWTRWPAGRGRPRRARRARIPWSASAARPALRPVRVLAARRNAVTATVPSSPRSSGWR